MKFNSLFGATKVELLLTMGGRSNITFSFVICPFPQSAKLTIAVKIAPASCLPIRHISRIFARPISPYVG